MPFAVACGAVCSVAVVIVVQLRAARSELQAN
jgi:hypothetical protein